MPVASMAHAHEAAEGVDLADHLALGQAADGGVAGHAGRCERVHGDHRNTAAVAEQCEAAHAASAPAWPPPMMRMSKKSVIALLTYHGRRGIGDHSISTQLPPMPRSTFSGTFNFIADSISRRMISDQCSARLLVHSKTSSS